MIEDHAASHTIPAGLRTDAPPEDAEAQLLAWAIDMHGDGPNQPATAPRWMIVQWCKDYPSGAPYWRWSVPGMSTCARILGWQKLPALDEFGQYAAERSRSLMSAK